MSKKAKDIMQELDISLQELKDYSTKLGIDIKTQSSNIDDNDVSRLESTIKLMKGSSVSASADSNKPKIKAVPIINKDKPMPKAPTARPTAKPTAKPVAKPVAKPTPKEEEVAGGSDEAKDAIEAIEAKNATPKASDLKQADDTANKDAKADLKTAVDDAKKADADATAKADKEAKAEATDDANDAKANDSKAEAPTEQKGEEYVNAPGKPMRFKKVLDVNDVNEAPKKAQGSKNEKADQRKSKTRGDNDSRARRNDRNEKGEHADRNSRGEHRSFAKDEDDNQKKQARPNQRKSSSAGKDAPVETKSKGKSKKFFDNKDKEKQSKFDRREDGRNTKNNKNAYIDDGSLEKQTRHKRKNKPKDEPEIDIEELLPEGTIAVTVPITVAGLSEQAEISASKIIMAMMKMGVMATINQTLDKDAVEMLAEDLGIQLVVTEEQEEVVEEGIDNHEDNPKDLKERPPIITVMGHVDHGKTSLLDAIRNTNVTAGESGGITQHIGASEVEINGKKIVFLDTPGHEAFTTMRARGAQVTDIAVLVVAADDGVMPQTVESISHAKAAGVPIIVAINKMDKPGANPDRVKQELTEHGILVEDWGGDVISVPVSAKKGEGIKDLLEMILLQAEVLELKANPDRLASGTVIEARLDKAKGPIATVLVTNGTLKSGQSVVAGTCSGKIRVMTNFRGDVIRKAGPATAVEILGLSDVPNAGDSFNVVKDDKLAREIAGKRLEKLREDVLAKNASTTLDKLFAQIQEGQTKELNLIIKGDVQGSVGAIISSLEKLETPEVKIKVIHSGVGTVNESDVMLAETSDAIIIGFNVRPTTAVMNQAQDADVEVRLYRVIYDIIDDISDAMKGMLDPEFKEEVLGKAEIRQTFKVPNVGIIGGAYVKEGIVKRNEQIRLVRDGIVIHEGTISSLKRFKDDAKEVAAGYECGIGIENYNDIKPDDIIECFTMVEIKR
jgi:translation initiation factor IF-2